MPIPAMNGKHKKKSRDYHKEWLKTKARIKVRRDALIHKLGGKCVRCGSSENLELDHPMAKHGLPGLLAHNKE